jgi:hypothetical protein
LAAKFQEIEGQEPQVATRESSQSHPKSMVEKLKRWYEKRDKPDTASLLYLEHAENGKEC